MCKQRIRVVSNVEEDFWDGIRLKYFFESAAVSPASYKSLVAESIDVDEIGPTTWRNEDLKNRYAAVPGKFNTFKVDVQGWRGGRLPNERINKRGNGVRCVNKVVIRRVVETD